MRLFIKTILAALAAGASPLLFAPALADDAPFLGTDPASVMGQGEMAVQQWLSLAHGHCRESFNAVETQTEFDYGVSDHLQMAVSLLYDWGRDKPAGGPATTRGLVGLRGEAIWQVTSADKAPLGLAIAVDPAFDPSSRGFAMRLLFTTYIAHFENVLNINFENEWEKDGAGHWQPSSTIAFNYGIAHALDQHWTIGAEFGNEFAFDSLLTNGNLGTIDSTFYAGPTLQYACAFATISFGVEMQLPISSGANTVNGYTADAERWRMGLRFSRSI